MKMILLLLLSLPFVFQVSAQSFEDYKKNVDGNFKTYEEDTYKAFKKYEKIFLEEGNKFLQSVNNTWGDGLVSSGKIWVEYSADMKTRRIVNFETGEITVQIKNDTGKADKKSLEKEVISLVSESVAEAYKNDGVSVNIEKQLKSEGLKALYSKPAETPVLNGLVNSADTLLQNSNITESKLPNGNDIVTLKTAINVLEVNKNVGSVHKKAQIFKQTVEKYAAERNIPPALVYAVIHNESAFNPMAKSYVPAYGMMQLVPTSGGKEASTVVFGKPTILAPSYLYDAEKNIQLGAIYLSQLYYIYFKDIKDSESRLYCTMSAYNTGPGNVSRAFTGKKNLTQAIPLINSMTRKEVYEKLLKSLPYDETKTYLKKVSTSYNSYFGY